MKINNKCVTTYFPCIKTLKKNEEENKKKIKLNRHKK